VTKCCYCKREIEMGGIVISCDGDFVCNQRCRDKQMEEMTRVCLMTTKQFYHWMGVQKEEQCLAKQ